IISSDHVHLNLKPNDIPMFPALINITAMVKEPPNIVGEDVFIIVIMTDYVDQEHNDLVIKCHYLASAPHLIHVTPSIKKNSILYINGEFILHNNESYAEIFEKSSKAVSFAETIAAKFKITNGNNIINSSMTRPSTIKLSTTQPYVTQSSVTQPPVIHSPVTQAFVTQPSVTQPSVAQHSITEHFVTQSSVTQPPVIHSPYCNSTFHNSISVIQPFVTQPSVIQSSITQPYVTQSFVTQP
ncbi:2892_t:CDS:2, partial [Gigaspora margarita]